MKNIENYPQLYLKIIEETLRWAHNDRNFSSSHDYKFMHHLGNIIMDIQQKIEK